MKKKELFLIILATIALVGIYTCKSTKVATNSTDQKQLIKQENTSNESNKSIDSLKYSENKCIGCKNLMDSLNNGYTIAVGLIGGIPTYIKKEENVPAIMKKVFPDVVFNYSFSPLSNVETHSCSAFFNGTNHNLKWEFNIIYKQMKHLTMVSLEDRIYAAIQLEVGFDKNASIISIEHVENKVDNILFNYKIIANINNIKNEFLLMILNNEFNNVLNKSTNTGYVVVTPIQNF
jgi:hypothetical protein